jgi:cyanophycinase-like exopeptidase
MSAEPNPNNPGLIVLFGSGETSPTGRKIFEEILSTLPIPPKLALLETPAGFELNSSRVIGRVADFFNKHLQNYSPIVQVIPARKRGIELSPDNPDVVEPILQADLIFLGPGSPTYATRQLRETIAWYYLIARHRLGAALTLASAATVAFSSSALPVYEIYKVGEDIHWVQGLDFFKLYGLKLVFVPHWNNNEGGTELDTSRCFMGKERFIRLMEMLQDDVTVIGLDEKTALIMDPSKCECLVRGTGKVTIINTGHKHLKKNSSCNGKSQEGGMHKDLAMIAEQRRGHFYQYSNGQKIPMSEIGPFHLFQPKTSLPEEIWDKALQVNNASKRDVQEIPPQEVLALIQARQQARQVQDWNCADELRRQIENLGWEVRDTSTGPLTNKLP